MRKINILVCADTSNFVGMEPVAGMTSRTFHLNRALRTAGGDEVEVRFLLEDNGLASPDWVKWPFRSWLVHPTHFRATPEAVLGKYRPDLVVVKSSQDLVLIGRRLRACLGARIVYEVHDDDAASAQSLGAAADEVEGTGFLQRVASLEADAAVTLTDEEADLIRPWIGSPQRLATIPMGATPTSSAAEDARRSWGDPADHALIFIGNLFHEPNQRAVRFFVHQVMPKILGVRPDVRLEVVGRYPADLKAACGGPSVRYHGVVTPLSAAMPPGSVGVCPVDSGSGMKSKIVDMMAHGVPVVCSPSSLAGLPASARAVLSVASNDAEFAASVLRLVENSGLRERVGQEGRRVVRNELSWSMLGSQALQAYQSFVGLERRRPVATDREARRAEHLARRGSAWQVALRSPGVWDYPRVTSPRQYVVVKDGAATVRQHGRS